MKKIFVFILVFFTMQLQAAEFNQTQTEAIEKIVHAYLIKNPEVLVEVSGILQKKLQQKAQEKATTAILKSQEDLFFAENDMILGNPKGKFTVVEFYDYQCPHCKTAGATLDSLIKEETDLRVVLKPFPILGEASVLAAKAVLAAGNKALLLHKKLLQQPGRLTKENILAVGKEIGLSEAMLEKSMVSDKYDDMLKENYRLAQQLGVNATPVFILAPTKKNLQKNEVEFVPGAVDKSFLKQRIHS